MKKCFFAIALVGLFAIQIPVKAQTTTSERIYILSSVWKDVCKNFAFPKRFKEVDPDVRTSPTGIKQKPSKSLVRTLLRFSFIVSTGYQHHRIPDGLSNVRRKMSPEV